jgi:hypothetical protein
MRLPLLFLVGAEDLAEYVSSTVQDLREAGRRQAAVFQHYDGTDALSETLPIAPLPRADAGDGSASPQDEVGPFTSLLTTDARFDAARVAATPSPGGNRVFALYEQRLNELIPPADPKPTLRDVAVPLGGASEPSTVGASMGDQLSAQPAGQTAWQPTAGRSDFATVPPPQLAPVEWSQPSLAASMSMPPLPQQPIAATLNHPLSLNQDEKSLPVLWRHDGIARTISRSSPWNSPNLFDVYSKKLEAAPGGQNPAKFEGLLLRKYRAETATLERAP